MSELYSSQLLRIGDCRFDPRSHELWRDDVCTRLPRRLSQLLLRLAQEAPEVLSRQVLIDEVWERRMVEDDVLSRAIAELRKALGDDTRTPRYIETIPKAGYRLCASVQRIEAAPVEAITEVPTTPIAPPPQAASRPDAPPMSRRRLLTAVATVVVIAVAVVLTGMRLMRPIPTESRAPHLAAEDAARIRPFTSGAGWESRPDISPDGQWVAYTEGAANGSDSQLILQSFDGLHREVLEDAAGYNVRPAFSPDGRRLVFLHFEGGRCELRLRSIPGGPGRKIADCATSAAATPAWSADQRSVLFSAPEIAGSVPGLASVDVDSGAIRTVTQPLLTEGPDLDPRFIPGQRAMTFARGFDGEQHLLRLDLDDAKAKPRVLFDGGRLQGHAWSADGKQILVATDQPGYRTLVLLDADGQQTDVLNARGARYPAWAASGDLVFEVAQYDANIWRIALDHLGQAAVAVVASTRYDSSPALSADGQRIVFVSTRNDYEQIFIANADGSDQRKLPMPDGQRWSRPSFSPDGRFVLVTGYDAHNRHGIYRHELVSGRNEPLADLGEDASGGRYTPDGSSIFYLRRNAAGARDLWRKPTAFAEPPIAVAGATDVDQFTIDGPLLAFTHPNKSGFHLLEWSTAGAPRAKLAGVQPITPFSWTLRGTHLYAVVADHDAPLLRRWDMQAEPEIESGQTLSHEVLADAIGSALQVSPDEKTLWFARTDQVTIDLMVLPAKARR